MRSSLRLSAILPAWRRLSPCDAYRAIVPVKSAALPFSPPSHKSHPAVNDPPGLRLGVSVSSSLPAWNHGFLAAHGYPVRNRSRLPKRHRERTFSQKEQLRRPRNAVETTDKPTRNETPLRPVPAGAFCWSVAAGLFFVQCNSRGFVARLLPDTWKAQVPHTPRDTAKHCFDLCRISGLSNLGTLPLQPALDRYRAHPALWPANRGHSLDRA